MVSYERNNFYQVSNEQVNAYYKNNLLKYQQAHLRDIKIAFKPAIAGTLSHGQSVEEQPPPSRLSRPPMPEPLTGPKPRRTKAGDRNRRQGPVAARTFAKLARPIFR